jgi:Flp pilus assembly protein TadD
MSNRSPWIAVLVVAAAFVHGASRADEAQDIDKLYRAGDLEQAMRRADAAIAAQPRTAQVRFLKGLMLSDLGRAAEARQTFVALTQDYPELADPYNNLAVHYAADGDLPKALAALESALRNDPTHRAARENIGDVYLALAIESWDAALASAKGQDATLQRKLKLARELRPPPVQATGSRPPG